MTPEKPEENQEPKAGGAPAEAAQPAPEAQEPEPYPVRAPQEDPRWAVWVVKIWVGFALLSLAFVLALVILGFFYD